MIEILLLSLVSCMTDEQSYIQAHDLTPEEKHAIIEAKPYFDKINWVFGPETVTIKDVKADNMPINIIYDFDNESQVTVFVENGTAKYIILGGKKKPIDEMMSDLERLDELIMKNAADRAFEMTFGKDDYPGLSNYLMIIKLGAHI